MGETPSRTTTVPQSPAAAAAAGAGPAWRLRLSALIVALLSWRTPGCAANADTKRLYHDLINGYSSLIRPVGNNSDRLTVKMGLRLSQLIDVVSGRGATSIGPRLPIRPFPPDSHTADRAHA